MIAPITLSVGCAEHTGDSKDSPSDSPISTLSQASHEDGHVWEPDAGFDMEPQRPFIPAPVLQCSESVAVHGVIENAVVDVYLDDGTPLGDAVAKGPTVSVELSQALGATDIIYAEQMIETSSGPHTSDPSDMRQVEELRGPLPKPRTFQDVWACSKRVGARGVVSGVQVELDRHTGSTDLIGDAWTTTERDGWWSIWHDDELPESVLPADVSVRQTYCPGTSEEESKESDNTTVSVPPKPLPPVDSVTANAGIARVSVKGSYTGAAHRIAKNGSTWFTGRAPVGSGVNWNAPDPVEASWDIEASHQLCDVGSSLTEGSIVPQSQLQRNLEAPTILEPVCPGARVIRVRPQLGDGHLAAEFPNSEWAFVGASSGSTSTVPVPEPGDLQVSSQVSATHYFEGEPSLGNIVSPTDTVVVDDTPVLEVQGATTHEPQFPDFGGQTVDGFVREQSLGPRIVLRCCESCTLDTETGWCQGESGPRTSELDIYEDSTNVATVTLYENYPGVFVGRWNWYMETGPTDPWPPSSKDFEAVVMSSPCNDAIGYKNYDINVLIGEPNEADDTTPSTAQLTVTGDGGNNATVDQGGPSDSVDILPEESADVEVLVVDPEGVKEAHVEGGGGYISSPMVDSDPNVVPIPAEITFSRTLELEPYESVDLNAKGVNYSLHPNYQETTSSTLTVTGDHPKPEITDITPDELYSDQTVTIDGDFLAYDALDTEVRFSDGSSTHASPSTFTTSVDQLEDVEIPSQFEGYFGTLSVTVATIYDLGGAGEAEMESDSFELELLDRDDTFASIGIDPFEDVGISAHIDDCTNNADPGGVTDVNLQTNPGGGPDFIAKIESNGRNDPFNWEFDIFSGGGATFPDLGGAAVFDNSCRVVAVLSDKGEGFPPRFMFTWIYFPEDDTEDPIVRQIDNMRLHHYDGTADQYVSQAFEMFANGDGTVVAVGYPDSNSQNLSVWGQINDMLPIHGPDENERPSASKACPSNCVYGMSLDIREARFEVDSQELITGILGDM
jgi:hypothetical protein